MNAAEHLLGRNALERHGSRTALVFGAQEIEYTQLAAQVARASGASRACGVSPGERVLLLMRDTPEFVAAWLGAVHSGAVAVALNTRLQEDEYRRILRDSDARLVIVEDAFAEAWPELAAELARAGRLAVAGRYLPKGGRAWRAVLADAEALREAHPSSPSEPAFWLYSSGTTGMPKGIVHAHAAVLPAGQALREVVGIEPGQKVLATSKLFFAYSLENGFLGPLANGAAIILHPDWADPETTLDLVARHQPAAFFSVPTFYRRLLALGDERLRAFAGVQRCVSAGESMPSPLRERWLASTGIDIISVYGMSETFCVCIATPRGSTPGAAGTGKPLAGVSTRLVTADEREAGPGEPAVLWVRHPALALGYANRPEQTRAQFRDGWFCTRDVFVRDAQGFFAHRGRSDEMLKIAGQWLQPSELEDAVAGNPAIADAACVLVTDADGLERLALFVTATGPAEEAERAAEFACERALPRYKRPTWIRAVPELPRTATGKIQRYRLRETLERDITNPVSTKSAEDPGTVALPATCLSSSIDDTQTLGVVDKTGPR